MIIIFNYVFLFLRLTKENENLLSYSLACGNVIPVKEGERVSVYISHPVPFHDKEFSQEKKKKILSSDM